MNNMLRDLRVENRPIGELAGYARNARRHSKKQIGQIAESMRQFGWTCPLLVDGNGVLITGHGRLEAAKLLGFPSVPVIRIDDLDEAQVKAYRLADNKLAANSSWDEELLKLEFEGLIKLDTSFELTATGFEMGEIDLVLGEGGNDKPDEADPVAADADGPRISRIGDLWLLGRHRLLCGSALDKLCLERLMDGETAELGLSDPPYNVRIEGNVSGLGRTKHGEFAMASGEMGEAEFVRFLETAFEMMAAHSGNGSIHFIFMDWRHVAEVTHAGIAAFGELKNICVWDKMKGGMGSLYRSAHELVFVFKNGDAPHVNNVALGAFGRNRTNVWRHAGVASFGKGRQKALAMHPTVKPVAIIADAILDCSNRGGIVLDPFCGSGTILIAAERTGRRARAIELDPKYVDVALRRFRRVSGIEPVHAESGRTLRELETDIDFVFERAMA